MPSKLHATMKSNHMSTTQLLSYQANLYSQTNIQPKQASMPRLPGKSSVSRRKHFQEEATIVEGVTTRNPVPTKMHRWSSSPVREQHRHNGEPNKRQARKKNEGGRSVQQEIQDSQPSSQNLNWQQTKLLKSKKVTRAEELPAWAATSLKPISNTNRKARRNGDKNDNDQTSSLLLPPLRFSSAPGKSAWRFVLPSPKPHRSSDLPNWYDEKTDNLVITLGYQRSTSTSSNSLSSPPSTPDLLEQIDTRSSIDSSSQSEELQSHTKEVCNTSIEGLLSSLSIYAGPSFSAAAPEACHLPAPSFLSRRKPAFNPMS